MNNWGTFAASGFEPPDPGYVLPSFHTAVRIDWIQLGHTKPPFSRNLAQHHIEKSLFLDILCTGSA